MQAKNDYTFSLPKDASKLLRLKLEEYISDIEIKNSTKKEKTDAKDPS